MDDLREDRACEWHLSPYIAVSCYPGTDQARILPLLKHIGTKLLLIQPARKRSADRLEPE